MELNTDLRQRHLSGWTKAIRALKPDDVEVITELPEIEFDDVTVKAAVMAGWFVDVDDPDIVDDMKGGEVSRLSTDIWKAFNEARRIDPK